VLNDPSFDTTSSFYGGQKVNEVFTQASSNVDTTFQWSPFQDYVYTQYSNQMGDAVNGKISFEQAMHNLQNNTVNFASLRAYRQLAFYSAVLGCRVV